MSYGGYGKMDPEYLKLLESQGQMEGMLGLGGLGLNVAGTVVQGIGAYQAQKEQERIQKQIREEEQRRYEERLRIDAEERRKREEQQQRENELRYGGYVREGQDRQYQKYSGYAARVGL